MSHAGNCGLGRTPCAFFVVELYAQLAGIVRVTQMNAGAAAILIEARLWTLKSRKKKKTP